MSDVKRGYYVEGARACEITWERETPKMYMGVEMIRPLTGKFYFSIRQSLPKRSVFPSAPEALAAVRSMRLDSVTRARRQLERAEKELAEFERMAASETVIA